MFKLVEPQIKNFKIRPSPIILYSTSSNSFQPAVHDDIRPQAICPGTSAFASSFPAAHGRARIATTRGHRQAAGAPSPTFRSLSFSPR